MPCEHDAYHCRLKYGECCTEDCIMAVHPLSLTISIEPSHAPPGCIICLHERTRCEPFDLWACNPLFWRAESRDEFRDERQSTGPYFRRHFFVWLPFSQCPSPPFCRYRRCGHSRAAWTARSCQLVPSVVTPFCWHGRTVQLLQLTTGFGAIRLQS